MAHMNVNPGIKKINSNPKKARMKERRAAGISKESPDLVGVYLDVRLAGILHKEIHC
jgi:hypothetical protein